MNSTTILQKIKQFFSPSVELPRDDQQHVMSQEEALDQTIDDSFPASDPPGHYSVSGEDKIQHQ